MSGLASMALSQGFEVEGSDMIESSYTRKLTDRGVVIHIGHDYNNIPGIGLRGLFRGYSEDNPDMLRATDLEIPKSNVRIFWAYLHMTLKTPLPFPALT